MAIVGPFAETKDLIAGFMIVHVDSYERAIELAGELSAAPGAGAKPIHEWLEVRPFMGAPTTVSGHPPATPVGGRGVSTRLAYRAYPDDDARNALCAPIPHPDEPLDWLRITLSDNAAQVRWLQDPDLMEWLESARLNVVRGVFPPFPDPRVRKKAVGTITAALNTTNDKLGLLMSAG